MSDDKREISFTISDEDHNQFKRLDAFLGYYCDNISRTVIKKYFQEGRISSSVKLELKKLPPAGNTIIIKLPPVKDSELLAQEIPLEILFEDEFLIIINKQAGLVVHPAPGNPDGTLVNAILFHCKDLKGIGDEKRPGIVHRLDKGTSGIMVIAKEQKTHEALVNLFSTHNIKRKYEAICLGNRLPEKDTASSLIGRNPNNRLKMTTQVNKGKKAITHLKTVTEFKHFTHVELTLETGRTHQIRVHLSELYNSPIINDSTYGRLKEEQYFYNHKLKELLKDYDHPFLHAKVLGFVHPITQKELYFESRPPKIFSEALKLLGEL